jgi:hypothetical protein
MLSSVTQDSKEVDFFPFLIDSHISIIIVLNTYLTLLESTRSTMITDYQRYFKNIPSCPHCKQELSCCEAPPVHIGDGLGWGSDILYICLNDYCPLFLRGWEQIENKYGHHASYRYMQLPDSNESNVMMVGNSDAFKGSVINQDVVLAQNERYQKEKKALAELDSCVAEKNLEPVLHLILEESAAVEGRRKAISKLLPINDLSCIDPIRNHTFRDTSLESDCNSAISQLLKAHFKKECPYCKEIIKAKASVCMYCKKDV